MEAKTLPTISSSRPRPHREQLRRTMTDTNGYRVSSRRSSLGCDYVFAPRPYHEVYTERDYLISTLHIQDAVRKQLTEQYSFIADQLSNFETPKQRRRLRKKISQLKPKITAAAEAQKAIFLRLSEVEIEMQSLQTLAYAHAQKLNLREWPSPGPTLASFSTLSDVSSGLSTCTTPLNATSPVFIPKRELLEPPNHSEPGCAAEISLGLATVEEVGEDVFCNHGLNYTYRTLDTLQGHNLVSWDGATEEYRLKRSPSLPSLQCIWPSD